MFNENIHLILIILIIVFLIFMFLGPEKNGKIIIINIILLLTSIAVINSIDLSLILIEKAPKETFSQIDKIQTFLMNNKKWIAAIIYVILLSFGLYRLQINNFSNKNTVIKLLHSILFPIITISFFLLNIEALILGPKIFVFPELISESNKIDNLLIKNFVFFTPFIMVGGSLLFIILNSHIGFKLSFSKKKKTNSDETNLGESTIEGN